MSERNWAKLGAGSGLGFVLLLVLGYIIGPNDPPAFGGDVASYVAANGNEIEAASSLYVGALVFFAFFIAAIAANTRKSDKQGRHAAAGHAGGITVLALGLAVVVSGAATVAASDNGAGSDVVTALFNTGSLLFLGVLAGAAVLTWATGVAAVRFGSLPGWLGHLSLAAGIYLAAVAIIGVSVETGAFNPYDGELVRIALLVVAAWSALTSVALLQKVK